MDRPPPSRPTRAYQGTDGPPPSAPPQIIVVQAPQALAATEAQERRNTRFAIGCGAIIALAIVGTIFIVGLLVFLNYYGFINDTVWKTVRRCRTFGC